MSRCSRILAAAACVAAFSAASSAHADGWGCGLDLHCDTGCWGIDVIEQVHVPPPIVKRTVTQVPTFTYETQLQPVTVYKPVLVKKQGPPKTIVTEQVIHQAPIIKRTQVARPIVHHQLGY